MLSASVIGSSNVEFLFELLGGSTLPSTSTPDLISITVDNFWKTLENVTVSTASVLYAAVSCADEEVATAGLATGLFAAVGAVGNAVS